MLGEMWYTVSHHWLSALVLGVAVFHVLFALIGLITLRQNLRLQRLSEDRK